MEIKRIDGKPECFGKVVVDPSHCKYCKIIKECVSELCYTTPDNRVHLVLAYQGQK